jgi:hypothetical protein
VDTTQASPPPKKESVPLSDVTTTTRSGGRAAPGAISRGEHFSMSGSHARVIHISRTHTAQMWYITLVGLVPLLEVCGEISREIGSVYVGCNGGRTVGPGS